MKTLSTVLGIFFFFLLASPAWGSPFVVCDPYPAGNIDYFEVTYDGMTEEVVYNEVDGKVVLKDLTGIPDGQHDIKARACNLWGCSDDSVPLEFVKQLPGIPGGVQLRK